MLKRRIVISGMLDPVSWKTTPSATHPGGKY